jgi:hypothetical protein
MLGGLRACGANLASGSTEAVTMGKRTAIALVAIALLAVEWLFQFLTGT